MMKTTSCLVRIILVGLLIYGFYILVGNYYDAAVGNTPDWLVQFMRMEMR